MENARERRGGQDEGGGILDLIFRIKDSASRSFSPRSTRAFLPEIQTGTARDDNTDVPFPHWRQHFGDRRGEEGNMRRIISKLAIKPINSTEN